MKRLRYDYILQEELGFGWLDKANSNDRSFIESLLKVYREKNKNIQYRVVRVIQ